MATTVEKTAPTAVQPEFDKLQVRLLEILNHLQCASGVLHDLQDIPEELQPACIVLCRATAELDQLYDELDAWSVRTTPQRRPRGKGSARRDHRHGREVPRRSAPGRAAQHLKLDSSTIESQLGAETLVG